MWISVTNGRERRLGQGSKSATHVQFDVTSRDHLHHFKGASLAVFLAVALHTDKDGWAFPSQALLAKETGYSAWTVKQAIASLCGLCIEGQRVMLRVRAFDLEQGKFTSNRYLLLPSPEEVKLYAGKMLHVAKDQGVGFLPVEKLPVEKPPVENPPTKKRHVSEEETKEEEKTTTKQRQAAIASLSEKETKALELLIDYGAEPNTMVQGIAKSRSLEEIEGWLVVAGREKLGWALKELRDGKPVPKTRKAKDPLRTSPEARRRYLEWSGDVELDTPEQRRQRYAGDGVLT